MNDIRVIMVGSLLLIGEYQLDDDGRGGGLHNRRLLAPCQLVPLPAQSGGMAWIAIPLPVEYFALPRGEYPTAPASPALVEQYTAQLLAMKVAQAGLTLPGGRGPGRH